MLKADNAYGKAALVRTGKAFGVEAHVAHQVHRKRIKEAFGWVKTVVRFPKTRHHGLARVDWQLILALVAFDLISLLRLLRAAT